MPIDNRPGGRPCLLKLKGGQGEVLDHGKPGPGQRVGPGSSAGPEFSGHRPRHCPGHPFAANRGHFRPDRRWKDHAPRKPRPVRRPDGDAFFDSVEPGSGGLRGLLLERPERRTTGSRRTNSRATPWPGFWLYAAAGGAGLEPWPPALSLTLRDSRVMIAS